MDYYNQCPNNTAGHFNLYDVEEDDCSGTPTNVVGPIPTYGATPCISPLKGSAVIGLPVFKFVCL